MKPSDILVMAPNIQAYIAADRLVVFGEAGAAAGPLPYHLAGRREWREARTRCTPRFARLLDLPRSRMTAPEVDRPARRVPQVMRRPLLVCRQAMSKTIAGWLKRPAVSTWVLDASISVQHLRGAAVSPNTASPGAMDRMLAGYCDGRGRRWTMTSAPVCIFLMEAAIASAWPASPGPQAAGVWAGIDAALVEIRAHGANCARSGCARAQWTALLEKAPMRGLVPHRCRWIRDACEAGIAVAATRSAGLADRTGAVRASIRSWSSTSFAKSLRERLSPRFPNASRFPPAQHHLLRHGAAARDPVPVIAVLGLDDGVFPRADGDGGLDPDEPRTPAWATAMCAATIAISSCKP